MDEHEFMISKEVEQLANIQKKQLWSEYLRLVNFEVGEVDPIILEKAFMNLKVRLYEEGRDILSQKILDMEKRLRDMRDDSIRIRAERDTFERLFNNQNEQSRLGKILSNTIANFGVLIFTGGAGATAANVIAGDIPSIFLAILLTLVGLFAINVGDPVIFKIFRREISIPVRQSDNTINVSIDDRSERLRDKTIDHSSVSTVNDAPVSIQSKQDSRM